MYRRPVTNCVPQGPVLGCLDVNVNHLDVNVGGIDSKFEDDNNIGGIVDNNVRYLSNRILNKWATEMRRGRWVLIQIL